MYYRDADAALLLYDTNTPSTFDSIRVWLEGKPLFAISSTLEGT